jgi:threonine synthase
MQLLAENEGVFTETAGGVTLGCAHKLLRDGRIKPEETTVLCITGNGLKTTDVLVDKYETEAPMPKLAEFEAHLSRTLALPEAVAVRFAGAAPRPPGGFNPTDIRELMLAPQ